MMAATTSQRAARLVPVLVFAGCACEHTIGITGSDAGQDAASDAPTEPDPDVLDTPEELDTPADIIRDLPVDPTDVLVPGETELLRPDDEYGLGVLSWRLPVAYSGNVYGLVLERMIGVDHPIGVYTLVPGGEHLVSSWLDSSWVENRSASICWTGEVFLVSIQEDGVGVRTLAVSEDGSIARAPEALLPAPVDPSSECMAASTSEGPFLVCFQGGGGELERVYCFRPDGSHDGTYIDADLDVSTRCAEVGREIACVHDSGIVFVDRRGASRAGEPVPGFSYESCMTCGCDVASTGDGVALIYGDGLPEECHLAFTLFDLVGNILVPPVTSYPVESSVISTASSGSSVLAVVGGGPYSLIPGAYLLDLTGWPIDAPFPIYDSDFPPDPVWTTFWEGDAYSVLWLQNGDLGTFVAYRRFDVDI